VLEHVEDPAQVIREVSRTLRPGGVFVFDTVNRTWRSKFVLIKMWQEWNLAGFSVPNAHVWEKFIRPDELTAMLRAAGLTAGPMRGMVADKSLPALLHALWRIRTGRVRGARIATDFPMRESDDLTVSYMGWARNRI